MVKPVRCQIFSKSSCKPWRVSSSNAANGSSSSKSSGWVAKARANDSAASLDLIQQVFNQSHKTAELEIVTAFIALNAGYALALHTQDVENTFNTCYEAIYSGKAAAKLKQWVEISNKLAKLS